jgi:hypothetical protein
VHNMRSTLKHSQFNQCGEHSPVLKVFTSNNHQPRKHLTEVSILDTYLEGTRDMELILCGCHGCTQHAAAQHSTVEAASCFRCICLSKPMQQSTVNAVLSKSPSCCCVLIFWRLVHSYAEPSFALIRSDSCRVMQQHSYCETVSD